MTRIGCGRQLAAEAVRCAHRSPLLTRVLEGVVDHKDLYLTPGEQTANDQCLPCCARAASGRLVLDL